MEGQQIVVTETTLEPEEAAEFFHILMPDFSGQLAVRSGILPGRQADPEHPEQPGDIRLTGMIYGLPAVNGYLNLTLD